MKTIFAALVLVSCEVLLFAAISNETVWSCGSLLCAAVCFIGLVAWAYILSLKK
jgi:hypothetical protein